MSFKKLILIFFLLFFSFYIQADESQELKYLIHSIKDNRIEVVQEIFEKNPDFVHKTYNGKILLYYAHKNADMTQLLLDHDTNPNTQSWTSTPLHFAITLKNIKTSDDETTKVIEALLKHGANPNIQTNSKKTPLHYIAESENVRKLGKIKIIRSLLEAGANPNIQDGWMSTPLHLAKDPEIVELLLKNGSQPDIQDRNGLTPLHLIIKSPDVIFTDKITIIKTFLKNDADLNIKDDFGRTPLYYVRNSEVAEFLLTHGSKLSIKSRRGQTPLHFVVNANYIKTHDKAEIIKVFFKYGINPNIKNKDKIAPLHLAKDPEIVEVFLKAGADPNSQNKRRKTPLHFVVNSQNITSSNKIKIIELLIKAGANPNIQDHRGKTPIDLAEDFRVSSSIRKSFINVRKQNSNKKSIVQSLKNRCAQIFRFPKK